MASLGMTFDSNTVEPSTPIETIPPGDYVVEIVNSEMRPTKDGSGAYLWLELDVVDGPFAKRKLWDRLNLKNANQQAVDIAQRALSAICQATGQLTVSDSEQLHHKVMIAAVKVRPASGQYGPANEIKGYKTANGSRPASQPAAASAATAKPTPPWKRQAA